MKVLRNRNNMLILENKEATYLISYNSVVAKVVNTLGNDYGLSLGVDWDYSQTTLKQVYEFIELYTTQRDEKGNMIAYGLGLVKNKHDYIKDLINKGFIKLLKEEEM